MEEDLKEETSNSTSSNTTNENAGNNSLGQGTTGNGEGKFAISNLPVQYTNTIQPSSRFAYNYINQSDMGTY